MIEFEKVSKSFRNTRVLENVSFKVDSQKLLAILGASGSGKTTLLRLIAGLEMPCKGKILQDGVTVSTPDYRLPPYRRKLSMIFQNLCLWPHMTVAEHLGFVLDGVSKADRPEVIDEMLQRMDLDKLRSRYPYQLSGGEQQRLAVARSLITRPAFLLMDEPFSHLDFILKKEMMSLLLKLRENTPMTIVYVTHNLDEAMTLADKIMAMEKGKTVFYGDPATLQEAFPQWFQKESLT